MSKAFDAFVARTLKTEGGYVNHPSDRGGPTNWGITLNTARNNGYTGPMQLMKRDEAVSIYYKGFYVKPGYSEVAVVSEEIADILFDLGVNFGPAVASRFAQRALNVLNERGKAWADIKLDGQFGYGSRAALHGLLDRRGYDGITVLCGMIRAQASVRYIELAEGNETQEDFMFGWQRLRGVGEAK